MEKDKIGYNPHTTHNDFQVVEDFQMQIMKWNNASIRKKNIAKSLCHWNMQKAFLNIIQNPDAQKKKTGESDLLKISTISNIKM